MSPRTLLATVLSLFVVACGGGANVPATGGGAQRYLPLAVGNAWTYRIVDQGGGGTSTTTKSVVVEAREALDGDKAGITAFRMKTARPGASTAENVSWQEDTGAAVVRHLDRSYDSSGALTSSETYSPSKLRVDESAAHVAQNATWTESYTEDAFDVATGLTTTSSKSETWTVLAAAESVTVPAGTFTCLKVRRVSTVNGNAGSDKTFWFAKGIGKVKELGASRTEELQTYVLE